MYPVFKRLWQRIEEENQTAQFLILVSFFITFLIARAIVYLQQFGIIPQQTFMPHIHHLVPGIITVLISGYISIAFSLKRSVRKLMAIIFGIGAALTIDEFALWVYLRDVYFADEGRISIDAVIITATFFLLVYLLSAVDHHRFAKQCVRSLQGKTN